jgi:FKBP-type peptidyl-prolyl cis-trans isomerase FklB
MQSPIPFVQLTCRTGAAISFLLFASFASAQNPTPAPAPAAPAANAAASHDLGLIFGNQLRNGGLESAVSLDALMQGVKEGLEGKPLTPPVKERATAFLRAGHNALAGLNKEKAREFLAKNTQAEGVATTASGLQYRVISPGDAQAKSPAATDHVTVQYRGTLLDGSEFDSSYGRGQPASFPLNGVIKGWQEALVLMKPGAKWRLFVPPELAYDTQPTPGIQPGSLLIFDVELLKVEPPPAAPAQ